MGNAPKMMPAPDVIPMPFQDVFIAVTVLRVFSHYDTEMRKLSTALVTKSQIDFPLLDILRTQTTRRESYEIKG